MARSYYNYGPYLRRRINGVWYDSSVREWTISSSQSGYPRAKPSNLLLNQTSHSAMETRTNRSCVTLPNGNYVPVSDYLAPGNSQASVQEEVAVADRRAASDIRRVVKDMTWDTAVFGAELGKTLSFVVTSARHLAHAYKLARRGDVFGLSELWKHFTYNRKDRTRQFAWKRVSNVWLQWRYAVRPLVMDLNDAMTELISSGLRPVVLRAQGQGTEWVDRVFFNGTWNNMAGLHRRMGSVRVEYGAYYTLSSSHSLTRLGLTNLPALLWELTPYSFVIDNVIPIGEYLSGLDATYGCTFLSGYRVEQHTWSERTMLNGAFDTASIKSYSRSPISTFPGMPAPAFQRVKGDLPSKALDALALLAQVVKAKR